VAAAITGRSRELKCAVEEFDKVALRGVLDIEFPIAQPFVQKPNSAAIRPRRLTANNFCNGLRLCPIKETFQHAQIYTLIFQCKCQVAEQAVVGLVPWRKHAPSPRHIFLVPGADSTEIVGGGNRKVMIGDQSRVPGKGCSLFRGRENVKSSYVP